MFHRGVMVTFDALTIYANRIRLDKETLKLIADGEEDILVIVGDKYIHAKQVEVNFKTSDPIKTIITK